jgi:hypothetical protein
VILAALVIGCRGDHAEPAPAPVTTPAGSATMVGGIPKLPISADGVQAVAALDASIAKRRDHGVVALLLERASIRGQLEDYVAGLEGSARWVDEDPTDVEAWKTRVLALSRVHQFAAAREALDHVKTLSRDPTDWEDATATLDEATGQHVAAAAYRERAAKQWPNPRTLTMWAASLAIEGRFDDAIALIPKAVATIKDNPATLFSWLYFQWGRIYELAGKLATARQLYAEARARLPASLEATVHLADTMRTTGEDPRKLVDEALAGNAHPALLALAGKLPEAQAEWERYVAALPQAFADHAARFYLGPGHDPKRALVLARLDHENRDTLDAAALLAEAAIAAGDPEAACKVGAKLSAGSRAHQFVAWRAYGACGNRAAADVLAKRLGLH